MAGVKFEFIAEVKPLLRGTKDVEAALDDVASSLDDVARDAKVSGDKAGRALGDGVDDGRVDVGKSTAKMETSFRDMARAANTHSKSAGDDIGKNTKKGMTDSTDSVDEFKKESVANFSEVASSFTGDMSQAADGVQGIMGGLAGSLPGPAGIAAGVLAGIGGALLASVTANAEAAEKRTQEMYDDMIASGLDFVSREFINQGIADIFGKTDEAKISWGELTKIVEATGVTQGTVAAAYAGDAESQRVLAEALRGKIEEVKGATDNLGTGYDQTGSKAQANLERMLYGVQDLGPAADEAATRAAGYATTVATMAGVTLPELAAIKGGYDNIPRDLTTNIKIAVDLKAANDAIRSWTPPMVTIVPQVRPGYMNP